MDGSDGVICLVGSGVEKQAKVLMPVLRLVNQELEKLEKLLN